MQSAIMNRAPCRWPAALAPSSCLLSPLDASAGRNATTWIQPANRFDSHARCSVFCNRTAQHCRQAPQNTPGDPSNVHVPTVQQYLGTRRTVSKSHAWGAGTVVRRFKRWARLHPGAWELKGRHPGRPTCRWWRPAVRAEKCRAENSTRLKKSPVKLVCARVRGRKPELTPSVSFKEEGEGGVQ
jgi:hypothetical protein